MPRLKRHSLTICLEAGLERELELELMTDYHVVQMYYVWVELEG